MQLILARLLAFLLFLSVGASAQDAAPEEQAAEIDEFEPAVSSEALAEMDSTDSDEVAAPQEVLAQDIRRTESSTGVMDEMDLGRTEITGNQELPKVLYIVPWQKSDPGELVGKPVNSLLDEVLAPIDRTEFMRQIDYYDDLYGQEED